MGRKKKKPVIVVEGEQTAIDKRGHEVKKYQDAEGNWFVEKNNNGAVHPEPCADEAAANDLFSQYVAE